MPGCSLEHSSGYIITITINRNTTINNNMVNVWVSDKQYAKIIKHAEKTPALFIREVLQEKIEKNGWDTK